MQEDGKAAATKTSKEVQQRTPAQKKRDKVLLVVLIAFVVIACGTFLWFVVRYGIALNEYHASADSSHSTSSISLPDTLPDSTTPVPQTQQTPKELFEFGDGQNDSNELYTRYVGTLTNVSDTTYYFVKVKGTFMDANGNVIDTTSTYACGDEGLEPGETTKFTLSIARDDRISSVQCSVFDYR